MGAATMAYKGTFRMLYKPIAVQTGRSKVQAAGNLRLARLIKNTEVASIARKGHVLARWKSGGRYSAVCPTR